MYVRLKLSALVAIRLPDSFSEPVTTTEPLLVTAPTTVNAPSLVSVSVFPLFTVSDAAD